MFLAAPVWYGVSLLLIWKREGGRGQVLVQILQTLTVLTEFLVDLQQMFFHLLCAIRTISIEFKWLL